MNSFGIASGVQSGELYNLCLLCAVSPLKRKLYDVSANIARTLDQRALPMDLITNSPQTDSETRLLRAFQGGLSWIALQSRPGVAVQTN